MVVDPAPVHGDMGQQIRHRLARSEGIRLCELVDLHEDIPGMGVMLLKEGSALLLELLISLSWDDVHHAAPM
jgi:hypothetical protein